MTLHAAPGGRALFAVSQIAGERTAWVRRIDGASGSHGPLLRFVDERIVAAFDAPDGGATVVTSNGHRVCVVAFRAAAEQPERRGCAEIAPTIVLPLGDRLAMIELDVAAPAPKRRAKIDVQIRWASLAGDIDPTPTATGLRFERPLDGMAVIDAAARPGAIDLLFYETAPTRRTKSRLGSARIGVATLRADGTFDPASRRALHASDLEYGGLAGTRAPRLVAGDAASVLVTSAGRAAPCEAIRVEPTLGNAVTSAKGCALDPYGLAIRGAADYDADTKLDALVAAEPRRAPGQSRTDGPLVAWVGDRAWFVAADGALRSADRATGVLRDERAPFAATRARVVWGAIARDGEGIAYAAGRLHRLDPRGATTPLPDALLTRLDANARAAVRAIDPPVAERHRAARIADTWWIARGDVVRVAPEPLVTDVLAGRAHADATVLVGGATRGLFLEIASGGWRVTALRPTGAIELLEAGAASPVRVGFDAVDRRRGGAIVAGPTAGNAKRVAAFVVDADGRASSPVATSIAIAEGEGVRLVALPAGGALLADIARRRVAWLDDDAHEIGAAEWPTESASAICVDGEPARIVVPTPSPGAFVRVPELAVEGTCTIGDVTWAADGTLRWFGSATRGLGAIAEVAVVSVPTAPASRATRAHASHVVEPRALSLASIVTRLVGSRTPPCSADMVSIAGRYCIDRYEAALVEASTGEPLSPDFAATPIFFDHALADWSTGRERWGSVHARAFPLPFVPAWQRGVTPSPVAVVRRGARPNGYVQGLVAEAACASAGKRLCTRDEFRTACRGEDDTAFPYGATYVDGACNVHRDDHPAALLHDNASMGHLDPRLDRTVGADGALLRVSGATVACRSRWGADAVYDLVGNLDEWIDDAKGAFAGGFFARATRNGCDSVITAHPKVYLDYSTGVRCCSDAR